LEQLAVIAGFLKRIPSLRLYLGQTFSSSILCFTTQSYCALYRASDKERVWGQPEDPLMGWYVFPSIFTTLDHTYESPCADLVVHQPRPPLQFLGGFGSDIWVYINVDSSVAIVHHSIVRALPLTVTWNH
jgi:hypothetical protein